MQRVLARKRWLAIAMECLPLITLALASIIVNTLRNFLPEAVHGHANDITWTLASLLTLHKSYTVYRSQSGRQKKAWLLITLGCASWFAGMLLWNYHRFFLDSYPEFPSVTDYGYLLMSPLVTFGVILFRKDDSAPAYLLSQALRIGLVFTALLIILFLIYGGLIQDQASSNTFIITSLSYPLLYFTSVIHGLTESGHQPGPTQRNITLLLVFGLSIHALANADYAHSLLVSEAYSSHVNIAWTLGFIPIYVAAIMQQKQPQTKEYPPDTRTTKASVVVEKGFLPLLLLSLSLTTYLHRDRLSPEVLDGYLLLTIGFTILLVGYILLTEYRERVFGEQLRDRELTVSSLVEAIPYGIQEYDLEGNITYSNQSMRKILATRADTLPQRKFWHIAVDEEHETQTRELFFQLVTDKSSPRSFTLPGLREDGNVVQLQVDWNYRYRPNGHLEGIVSVITDITKHKLHEARYQTLVDRMSDGVAVYEAVDDGEKFIFRDMNQVGVRLGKVSREDIVGHYLTDIFPLAEEVGLQGALRRVWKTGLPEELPVRQYKDQRVDVWVENHIFKLPNGEVVAVYTDLTKQKQTEDSLRRSQKMEAIGEMAGGIAHDFNNILGIVLGNLDLLKLDLVDEKRNAKRLEAIEQSIRRATTLTSQLLGFSRRQATQLEIVNINDLVLGKQQLITRSVTPEVEIEQHLDSNLWLTQIDPGDFEDTLINLVLNAHDAMPNGGRLTLATQNIVLDSSFCDQYTEITPGEYVELEVSDSGIGIPSNDLEHIFEPFYTTKPQGKGTGLGLAMVFGFVKRSKGLIVAKSSIGISTTFQIYLPRSEETMRPGTRITKAPEKSSVGDETILIVDDEPELLALNREGLEKLGYRILTATDGATAKALLSEHPEIALLFSDVVMPGRINGIELAREVNTNYPNIKVLLTSGYSGKAFADDKDDLMRSKLLNKPYTGDELAKRVRAILDGDL